MAGPKRKERANLRDVAREAGVSVATVSRVLNMPQKVSPATRDRVQAAIDHLRFVPSAAARAINSGRTRMVGALIPTLDNAIFARVLDGLESCLSEKGLSMVVASTDYDPAIEAEKAQELVSIGAEGLVVAGITHDPAFEALIERAQLPAVAISYYSQDYRLPTVGYDNALYARLALNHLLDLGHRRIAIVHGPCHNNDRTRARLDGLRSQTRPVELDFFEAPISIRGGCGAAQDILATSAPYTAYLCMSDVLAMGAIFELQRHGISVPQDISVMGMENLPSSEFVSPSLTSMRLQVHEMGVGAALALAGWVESGERPASKLLPAELIARESTAPPRSL